MAVPTRIFLYLFSIFAGCFSSCFLFVIYYFTLSEFAEFADDEWCYYGFYYARAVFNGISTYYYYYAYAVFNGIGMHYYYYYYAYAVFNGNNLHFQ